MTISSARVGTLFIVSAPSGAGKTSLVKALRESTPGLAVSVSHTTRPQRSGEVDGKDYFFVDHDEFQNMVDDHAFLEHAKVFDNFYGTSKASVEAHLESGHDVILEIDWQGARQVRGLMPKAQSIFILPPSLQALESRLRGRAQDDDAVIQRRMKDAIAEMSHFGEFDYLVINDQFDDALLELQSIVITSRLKVFNQSRTHGRLIEALIG
jgi:guanylate kinase